MFYEPGLLGKGVIRAAHRVWQYGCVGALGSMALLLLLPAACILVSCASALAAVTAPVWVPPLALLAHAGMALFYDLDCPRPDTLNRYPLSLIDTSNRIYFIERIITKKLGMVPS